MVALPLFKLASLFLRQLSKYGANRIKVQAHEHPKFRAIAARYGQHLHQLNMRLSVAALKDSAAEQRAKERAEAPTVKTEEQSKAEEEAARKKAAAKDNQHHHESAKSKSVWKRKFRPLPEAKAVDLFADVVGDSFIITIASVLIIYEYVRSKDKADPNTTKIAEMTEKLQNDEKRIEELEEAEKHQQKRVEVLEQALELLQNHKKGRVLSS